MRGCDVAVVSVTGPYNNDPVDADAMRAVLYALAAGINQVDTEQLAPGCVTTEKLGYQQVTVDKIHTDVGIVPVGVIVPYASGTIVPANWLLCYGQDLATAYYERLFAVIGYTYGGSGNLFKVPDLRARVPVGLRNMGGTDVGTTAIPGMTDFDNMGEQGGTYNASFSTYYQAGIEACYEEAVGMNIGLPSSANSAHFNNRVMVTHGSFDAHPNLQPYIILNYLIRAV